MAKAHTPSILKPEHLQLIKDTLQLAKPLPGECDRAEQLGIDCNEYRLAYAGAVEWLRLAAKLYFPEAKL